MSFKPMMYAFFRAILSPILRLLYGLKFINPHNIPQDGAYIIASNHLSALDPIFLAIGQRYRKIHYMAKAEIFKNKLVAWLMYSVGAFPVSRGSSDMGSVKHFESLMEQGECMGIFIEGTRSKTGEFLKPKNGAALIAYDTKTPVIPVCITKVGNRRICHFGTPLSLDDLGFVKGGAREYREASRRIMDEIKKLRKQDLQ